MTYPNRSIRQKLHRRLPMLDQLVAEELQRTHSDGGLGAVKKAWRCPSCHLSFDQITTCKIPDPASLPHRHDCAWLQRWQSLPESCRLDYQALWQTRPAASRHTIRAGFTPRHPVVIYRTTARV